jgi:hypothetical protein
MAAIDCSDPGGHEVDYCGTCDTCFCVYCGLSWSRPPRNKVLYPTFYWPGKGYVTSGGCMALFDAGEAHVSPVGCH